ncbi:21487_t:CDS:2, partial [Dentiscutata erythropus]
HTGIPLNNKVDELAQKGTISKIIVDLNYEHPFVENYQLKNGNKFLDHPIQELIKNIKTLIHSKLTNGKISSTDQSLRIFRIKIICDELPTYARLNNLKEEIYDSLKCPRYKTQE